jgi:hypothetical protein
MDTLETLVRLAWLVGAAGFVLGLMRMNSPATARAGNWLSAGGMAIAIGGTVILLAANGTVGGIGWLIIAAGVLLGGAGGDEHRADEDDPVDRVRPGHQRRVECRRNLRDHREAAQDREDEDRQRGQQLRAHAAPPAALTGAGLSSFFTASERISPP